MASTYTPLTCTWQHMAVVRSGAVLSLYAAGTSVANWAVSASANFTGSQLLLGGNGTGTRSLTGLVSSFRVVVGSSIYTSQFSPPLQPPSPIPGTALLLLAASAQTMLVDSSFAGVVVSASGVSWNAAGPFTCFSNGTGSILFNYSAGSYIGVPLCEFGTTCEYKHCDHLNAWLAHERSLQLRQAWVRHHLQSNFG